MNVRTLAAGFAIALLASLVAPLNVAQAPQIPPPQPGIEISTGSLLVLEAGTASYTVNLTAPPLGPVAVDIAVSPAGGDFTLSTTHLEFTPLDYDDGSHRVTVTGRADNNAVNGSVAYTFTHTASSDTDPDYEGMTAVLPVYAADNDAGLSIVQSGDSTTVKEDLTASDARDTLVFSLGSAPSGTVVAALGVPADNQLSLTRFSARFDSSNPWYVPITVTVSALSDDVVEGPMTRNIAVTTTGPGTYGSIAARSIPVSIVDDDFVGLRFLNETNAALVGSPALLNPGALAGVSAETNGTVYKVALGSRPSADVTVDLSAPASEVTLNRTRLTFPLANWKTPQSVTVTGKGDAVDEGSNTTATLVTIVHNPSSTDAAYNALANASAVFRHFDDDTAGYYFNDGDLNATPEKASLTEGGASASYKVHLSSQPTANVTVSFESNAQLSVTPAKATFTATTWMNDVTFTVAAVDDPAAEGTHDANLVQTAKSADLRYNATTASIPFGIVDNDGFVLITESGGSTRVKEAGASDTFAVHLKDVPDDVVTVTVTAPAGLKVNNADSVTLTFDPDPDEAPVLNLVDQVLGLAKQAPIERKYNPWNVPQTITVTAPADGSVTGSRTLAITSTSASEDDAEYDGAYVNPVQVYRLDSDPGFVIEESNGTTEVTEGGKDSYTVRLATPPTDGVIVQLSHDAQVTLSASRLTFDAFDWDEAKTVTVTGVDDKVDEAPTVYSLVRHQVFSNDGVYGGLTARDVNVTVRDFDTTGITLQQTGSGTAVSEAGGTDTYTLVLTSKPPSKVTIGLSSPGGQLTLPSQVEFLPSNWNVTQTVTVAAQNDSVAEGPHTAFIHHAVTGPTGWAGLSVPDVSVAITDNDAAGLVITSTGGPSQPDKVYENGSGDGFNVRLSSKPVTPITVSVTSSDPQLFVQSPTLTFNDGNWNQVQVAWFSAFNDAVVQGDRTATITFKVTSGDANYVALAPVAKTMQIDDDDA